MTDVIRGNEIRYGKQLYLAAPTVEAFDDTPLPEAILRYLSDAQSAIKPVYARTIAQEIISGDGICFSLRLIENDTCIGYAQLGEISWQARHATLSIAILDENHLASDIISDAIQTVLQIVFWEANLNRVEIRCVADNSVLKAALETLHFTHEGTLRHHAYRNGHHLDVLIYSILAREWSL